MSSMIWHDNILVQRLMSHTEELGRLKYDSFTGTYVLWLKDHWGRFGPKGGHFRGESAPPGRRCDSRTLSRRSAPNSASISSK